MSDLTLRERVEALIVEWRKPTCHHQEYDAAREDCAHELAAILSSPAPTELRERMLKEVVGVLIEAGLHLRHVDVDGLAEKLTDRILALIEGKETT